MPCDTIQTVTVEAELKNINWKLLKKALEAMGFTVNAKEGFLTFYGVHKETGTYHVGTYQNGKFSEKVSGNNDPLEINAVKRAYSHQIIKSAASTFGWKLNKSGKHTYSAQKR